MHTLRRQEINERRAVRWYGQNRINIIDWENQKHAKAAHTMSKSEFVRRMVHDINTRHEAEHDKPDEQLSRPDARNDD